MLPISFESKGLPDTAKKFVDDAFRFFEKLGNPAIKYKPCKSVNWNMEGYRCSNFKKKFTVAFLDTDDEIIICDFAVSKNLV